MNKKLVSITLGACLALFSTNARGEEKSNKFGSDIFPEARNQQDGELQLLLAAGDIGGIVVVNKLLKTSPQNISPQLFNELRSVQTQLIASQERVAQLTQQIQTTAASAGQSTANPTVTAARQTLAEAESKLNAIAGMVAKNDEAMTQMLKKGGLLKEVVGKNAVALDVTKINSVAEQTLVQLANSNHMTQEKLLLEVGKASQEVAAARASLLGALETAGHPGAQKLVATAEEISTEMAKTRAAYLEALAKANPARFGKVLGFIRVVGNIVFFGDLGIRAYAWYGLEANPGYFPIGKVAQHYGNIVIKDVKDLDTKYGVSSKVRNGIRSTGDYIRELSGQPDPDTHGDK